MSFDALLFSALFLLITVSVTVGISKKLGLGSILGLLIAGMIVGPYTPGPFITDQVETLRHFAEIGVVLLLFLIGLEMKPAKLWDMRKEVFGLGSLQIVLSGIVIGFYANRYIHTDMKISFLIGLTLALSSTAFVMQILKESGAITSRYGNTSFAILLMQDLAIVPLLAIVPILSDSGTLTNEIPLWQQILFVVGMIGGLIVFGRYVIPYLLERFIKDKNREAFVFTIMLAVVFAAWAMEHVGLSMALGAFLMGMTLSNSRYSYQIEAHIEPFKGVFMSLFFVAVGMSLDVNTVMDHPLIIVQHVFIIMLLKIIVLFFLAMVFGLTKENSLKISFLLSQSGEFGFVLFGAAKTLDVISGEIFAVGIAVISITMLLTPFYVKIGDMFARRVPSVESHIKGEIPSKTDFEGVVVVGYGRFGQVIANMLRGSQIPFIAYDHDLEVVESERKKGENIFYGDLSEFDFISAMHLEESRLVVVTVDSHLHSSKIVSHIKHIYPSLTVFARSKDIKSKNLLLKHGANWVMPEAIEGSIRMGAETLLQMGIAKENVELVVGEIRKDDYNIFNT